jgi:hypothetical protein
MKARSFILGLTSVLEITFLSCDRDGDTGNGANAPTSQFESDKAMKAGGKFGTYSDNAAKETTTLNTLDTNHQKSNSH